MLSNYKTSVITVIYIKFSKKKKKLKYIEVGQFMRITKWFI